MKRIAAIALTLPIFCFACAGSAPLPAKALDLNQAGVAALARKHRKPVLAFAGSIAENAAVGSLFDALCAIIDEPVSLEAAMSRGAEFLARTAARAARLLQLGQRL